MTLFDCSEDCQTTGFSAPATGLPLPALPVPARPGLPNWDSVHANPHWRHFHAGPLAVGLDLRHTGEPVEDCPRGDHWRIVGCGQHVRFALLPRLVNGRPSVVTGPEDDEELVCWSADWRFWRGGHTDALVAELLARRLACNTGPVQPDPTDAVSFPGRCWRGLARAGPWLRGWLCFGLGLGSGLLLLLGRGQTVQDGLAEDILADADLGRQLADCDGVLGGLAGDVHTDGDCTDLDQRRGETGHGDVQGGQDWRH